MSKGTQKSRDYCEFDRAPARQLMRSGEGVVRSKGDQYYETDFRS